MLSHLFMHTLLSACMCPDGNQTCGLGTWGRHSNPLSSRAAQGHPTSMLSILVILLLSSYPWMLRHNLDGPPSNFPSYLSFTNPLVMGRSQPYIHFMIQHLSHKVAPSPQVTLRTQPTTMPPGPALLTSTLATHPYCPSDHGLQLPAHQTPPVMLLRAASPSRLRSPCPGSGPNSLLLGSVSHRSSAAQTHHHAREPAICNAQEPTSRSA